MIRAYCIMSGQQLGLERGSGRKDRGGYNYCGYRSGREDGKQRDKCQDEEVSDGDHVNERRGKRTGVRTGELGKDVGKEDERL